MSKIKKYINTISETDNAGYSEYDATPIMYDPTVKKWIKTLTGTDIILGKPNVYTSELGKKYSSVLIPLETGMNGDHFLEAVKELRPKGYELMPGQSSQGKPFLGVVKITDTNENISESAGTRLKDIAKIATNMQDADFWLVRKGSDKTVGKPVKEFDPSRIGIKVVKTDVLDPNYLYYAMMNLHNQGHFARIANGTTNLVNITVNDIANIPLGQQSVDEDWNKVNHHDKTSGMSQKAVNAYRRENPGSKLKTAVTTKPSKLKKGSKAANRRKSFCARMSGMKKAHASAKTKRDPDSPINKALRRWNCESIEQMQELVMIAEQIVAKQKIKLLGN